MANMAPQLPGLHRAEWEHLEETVRAWALAD
jgi:DNA/RNA endonuclease G (NUC1)